MARMRNVRQLEAVTTANKNFTRFFKTFIKSHFILRTDLLARACEKDGKLQFSFANFPLKSMFAGHKQ